MHWAALKMFAINRFSRDLILLSHDIDLINIQVGFHNLLVIPFLYNERKFPYHYCISYQQILQEPCVVNSRG